MKYIAIVVMLLLVGVVAINLGTNTPTQQPDKNTPTTNTEKQLQTAKKIEVYDGISVPVLIEELDLSGAGLEGSLKAEVRHLTQLRVLNLSNNNFTDIPAEVGQLSQLEVLKLSDNPVTGLPHEIANLKNLKTLDLRNTQYSAQDLAVIQSSLPELEVLK